MRRPRTHQSGLSLLEILFVVSLLGVLVIKASLVVSSSNEILSRQSMEASIEDQARSLVDRIALGIMSTDRDALTPVLNPEHSTGIRYQVSLGMEDGEVVWAPLEEIALAGAGNEVVWRESPNMTEEKRVVWSRQVRALLEGEEVNDIDDNGNGLVDEEGLNFLIEGNQVTVRISLGVFTENGEQVVKSVESTVSCRNNPFQP